MNIEHIENIVLEGGGMKGIAFCGALQYLEERGVMKNIKRVIGSSAGALYATLIACRSNSTKCREIITKANFKKFKDDGPLEGFWGTALGWTMFPYNVYRLLTTYGWCKGDAINAWYTEIIKELTGSETTTFKELHQLSGIELVITGTNIVKMRTEYLSHLTKPNMEVRQALRISTCIPFLFPAVSQDGDLFIDGGVLNNYPIWYFDEHCYSTGVSDSTDTTPAFLKCDRGIFSDVRRPLSFTSPDTQPIKTLGLKLMASNEIVTSDGELEHNVSSGVKSLKEYATSIVDALLLQIERSAIHKDYWRRTIIIPTADISATDFSLNIDAMEWLIKSGYKACQSATYGV